MSCPLSPPDANATISSSPSLLPQMLLLDRAIKMAAELDEPEEMNFVRKHARQQAEELGLKNLRDAAVRVFSNSSGERGRVHKGRGSGGLAAKASRESVRVFNMCTKRFSLF